jgi:hypothetical protein
MFLKDNILLALNKKARISCKLLFRFVTGLNFTEFMAQIDEKDKLKQTDIRFIEIFFKDNLEEKA